MRSCPNHSGLDQSVSYEKVLSSVARGLTLGVVQREVSVRLTTMAAAKEVSCYSISYIVAGEFFFIDIRAKNDTEGFS